VFAPTNSYQAAPLSQPRIARFYSWNATRAFFAYLRSGHPRLLDGSVMLTLSIGGLGRKVWQECRISGQASRKTTGFLALWRRPCPLRAEVGVTDAGKAAGRGSEKWVVFRLVS